METVIRYDGEHNQFENLASLDIIPFLYDAKTYDGRIFDEKLIQNYTIIPLYKIPVLIKELAEVVISEIDGRIGMLIPLKAVENINTEIVESWQRWYAFIATYYYSQNKEIFNLDAKKDNIVFLIIETERLPIPIEQLNIALQAHGIYDRSNRLNSLTCELPRKIRIQPLSKYLNNEPYVKVFCQNLVHENNPILRFMHMYQVLELLMDDALIDKFINTTIQVLEGNFSSRAEKGEFNEINRLHSVFDLCNVSNRHEFQACCQDFLKKVGKHCQNVFADSLYQVRNTIIHRSRIIDDKLIKELEVINDYFELLLYDILFNYKTGQNKDIVQQYQIIRGY